MYSYQCIFFLNMYYLKPVPLHLCVRNHNFCKEFKKFLYCFRCIEVPVIWKERKKDYPNNVVQCWSKSSHCNVIYCGCCNCCLKNSSNHVRINSTYLPIVLNQLSCKRFFRNYIFKSTFKRFLMLNRRSQINLTNHLCWYTHMPLL